MTITSGSTIQLTTHATYSFDTGLVQTVTDPNNQTTTYAYDSIGRLTDVARPDGVHLTTSYNDSSTAPAVTAVSPIDATNSATAVTTFDGLGRTTRRQLQNASGTVITTVDTAYDAVGRPISVTNPYAPGDTPVYTTTSYDGLGRVAQVIPPDGSPSANNWSYAYSGNIVTVTDPAGKQRRTYGDALGRLVRVDEPGGTPGQGTVTISGTEQSITTYEQYCAVYNNQGRCVDWESQAITTYDSGPIVVAVGSFSKTVTYNGGSTPANLASTVANAFNSDASSPVDASASSATITFTAKQSGAATNYSLSASSATNDPTDFPSPSFSTTPSGATLTGGTDSAGTPSLARPFATFYAYNALDELTQVSQGVQTRTYAYNGLGQLTSAATPESGPVSFTYTNAGNVATRTDARNITATYSYDGLNRLAGISYNDTPQTPGVSFTYDTGGAAANALGRLVSMTDGSGSESSTYDLLGRITQVSKTITGSGPYVTQYAYNLASELTSITYPSGRVVAQAFDSVGRLNRISSAGTDYLSQAAYNAAGETLGFTYGNGVQAQFGYNTRLQLASLRYSTSSGDLLNLTYGYGTANNGQIQTITDNLDPTKSLAYTYDALARLQYASAGPTGSETWKLGMVYDRYGNRTNENLLAGTGPSGAWTYDVTTNRLNAPYAYDAGGNLANDTFNTYAFDAENRVKQVTSAGATYVYDGNGLRVQKTSGGTTTTYIFSGAKVIAEYVGGSLSKEYLYAGSRLLATVDAISGTTAYHHPDHLSTRVETDANATVSRTFGQFPFGEVWYETGTASKSKFTTYERDSESGDDYAIARYYANLSGRFLSPDPLAGRLSNPQSLNRYAYVVNDPVGLVDPFGLDCLGPSGPFPCDYFDNKVPGAPEPGEGSGVIFLFLPAVGPRHIAPLVDTGDGLGIRVKRQFSKTFPCTSTASQVMNALENNFASFANNPSGGALSTFAIFTPGPVAAGQQIDINVGVQALGHTIGYRDVSVTVQSATPNQLVFQSTPTHVLYPATVSFSATDTGKDSITFTTSVDATTNGILGTLEFVFGGGWAGETNTWNNLLNQVSNFCGN